jgi:outer membrane protein OmpA-like peptidoglycan-associated protein
MQKLFETASAAIIHTSYQELDQLAKYLQENPSVEIEKTEGLNLR